MRASSSATVVGAAPAVALALVHVVLDGRPAGAQRVDERCRLRRDRTDVVVVALQQQHRRADLRRVRDRRAVAVRVARASGSGPTSREV